MFGLSSCSMHVTLVFLLVHWCHLVVTMCLLLLLNILSRDLLLSITSFLSQHASYWVSYHEMDWFVWKATSCHTQWSSFQCCWTKQFWIINGGYRLSILVTGWSTVCVYCTINVQPHFICLNWLDSWNVTPFERRDMTYISSVRSPLYFFFFPPFILFLDSWQY